MTTNLVTNNFKYRTLKTLQEKFSDLNTCVYFFYGRNLEWVDENIPDNLEASKEEERLTKSNIMALKKITSRDLILGAKRYRPSWEPNISYDMYTDQEELAGKEFYTITSENKVYKCLDNNSSYTNNSLGVAIPTPGVSVDEPIGGDIFIGQNDNYIWKYMFTLRPPTIRKFNIPEYIPIDAEISTTQDRGTINYIKINSTGSDYSLQYVDDNLVQSYTKVPLFIFGNGNINDSASIEITSITSQAKSINIINGQPIPGSAGVGFQLLPSKKGSGYKIIEDEWCPVQIRQLASETGDELGEFKYAYGIAKFDNNGQLENLRITDPGAGYSLGEAKVVQSSAIGYGELSANGNITKIKMDYYGENFSYASVIPITDKLDNPSTNASLTPIISPALGHGSNPGAELVALNLLFNVRLAYEEVGGDFSVQNDFRSVGLIENIEQQNADGTNIRLASDSTLSGKTDLYLDNDVDFNLDSEIVGLSSGAKGRIIDIIEGNIVRIIRDIESSNTTPFLVNEAVRSSGVTAKIASISQPEYVPYSGDVLFINNRSPVARSDDQIETINFVLTV